MCELGDDSIGALKRDLAESDTKLDKTKAGDSRKYSSDFKENVYKNLIVSVIVSEPKVFAEIEDRIVSDQKVLTKIEDLIVSDQRDFRLVQTLNERDVLENGANCSLLNELRQTMLLYTFKAGIFKPITASLEVAGLIGALMREMFITDVIELMSSGSLEETLCRIQQALSDELPYYRFGADHTIILLQRIAEDMEFIDIYVAFQISGYAGYLEEYALELDKGAEETDHAKKNETIKQNQEILKKIQGGREDAPEDIEKNIRLMPVMGELQLAKKYAAKARVSQFGVRRSVEFTCKKKKKAENPVVRKTLSKKNDAKYFRQMSSFKVNASTSSMKMPKKTVPCKIDDDYLQTNKMFELDFRSEYLSQPMRSLEELLARMKADMLKTSMEITEAGDHDLGMRNQGEERMGSVPDTEDLSSKPKRLSERTTTGASPGRPERLPGTGGTGISPKSDGRCLGEDVLHWSMLRFREREDRSRTTQEIHPSVSAPPLTRERLHSQMTLRVWRIASMVHLTSFPVGTVEMADAGWYYDEDTDKMCCYCCSLRIPRDNWSRDDNPAHIHAMQSPDCPSINPNRAQAQQMQVCVEEDESDAGRKEREGEEPQKDEQRICESAGRGQSELHVIAEKEQSDSSSETDDSDNDQMNDLVG
ncbi:hypothetical protein BaRGS_00005602 [Batillaria attramentaria]|uniref:Uncharacterized protein n=1 Tax=Batillaria attramentaria TaxID=370345 RepID=A0ABD0LTZ9_9CAEN